MGLLIFFYWFVWFRMWSFKSSLYILDTSSLSDIFSQALVCHVKPVLASLKEHTFIICIKSNFSSALMGHAFGVVSQISSPKPKGHWIFPQYFYLDISQFSIYIWVYDPFGVNFCERIKLCIYICFFFFLCKGVSSRSAPSDEKTVLRPQRASASSSKLSREYRGESVSGLCLLFPHPHASLGTVLPLVTALSFPPQEHRLDSIYLDPL